MAVFGFLAPPCKVSPGSWRIPRPVYLCCVCELMVCAPAKILGQWMHTILCDAHVICMSGQVSHSSTVTLTVLPTSYIMLGHGHDRGGGGGKGVSLSGVGQL